MTKRILHVVTLIALCLLAIGPFLWLVMTALKSNSENIFNASQFLPTEPTLEHFATVWNQVPMGRFMMNSIAVATVTILLNLTFSTLAAYPLARMKFKGRQGILAIILATMMIPFQVIMIPLYLLILKLGWSDQSALTQFLNNTPLSMVPLHIWISLALPFAVSGFGVFFMRQAMVSIPKALEESAVMDGCNSLQVLWQVIVPLLKPALATLAIFTLMASWGEFLWPSIVLGDEQFFTLPVGLVYLEGTFSANWRVIAAGTLFSMLPMLIFFLLLQRYFMSGQLSGAVKG